MKILSNKKWEELMQQMTEYQLEAADARNDNVIYSKQVDELIDQSRGYEQLENNLFATIHDLQKENKRLKYICTKNGVSYEKKDKDGK